MSAKSHEDDHPSDEHEEVVNSLLDLQRRLRGEGERSEGEAASGGPAARSTSASQEAAAEPGDALTVSVGDLAMRAAPGGAGGAPADRIASLAERVARLEQDLDDVLGAIRRLREGGSTEEVEARIRAALAAHRDGLGEALDEHFARVEREVGETLRSDRGAGGRSG